jgi:hypothetical protein
MQVNNSLSQTNASYDYSVGSQSSRAGGYDLTPQAITDAPADIAQLCRPSQVSLSPAEAQSLLQYSVYNSSSEASANALAQTLRLLDNLTAQF